MTQQSSEALIERLRDWCRDWNGEPIADNSTTRSVVYCADVREIIAHLEALTREGGHDFWGAGEPDCPREIKAGNGEIKKLRCKRCGQDNPRATRCPASQAADPDVVERIEELLVDAYKRGFDEGADSALEENDTPHPDTKNEGAGMFRREAEQQAIAAVGQAGER
jgi:hypothetical protein